jgi:hypothetical protein
MPSKMPDIVFFGFFPYFLSFFYFYFFCSHSFYLKKTPGILQPILPNCDFIFLIVDKK